MTCDPCRDLQGAQLNLDIQEEEEEAEEGEEEEEGEESDGGGEEEEQEGGVSTLYEVDYTRMSEEY